MKCKLLAAGLAAVGLMFSAHADGEPSKAYGTDDFQSYGVGHTMTNADVMAGSTLGTWSAGAADKSEIAASGGDNYLKLNTEGDIVTNSFNSAAAMSAALISGETNIVMEATVAFVPSDEIEDSLASSPDLKFALYALEREVTEQEITEDAGVFTTNYVDRMYTNLVVYHAYNVAGGDPVCTNEIIENLPAFATDPLGRKDIKVTMKNVDSASPAYFFKLEVGESVVTAPMGCTDAESDANDVPTTGGCWFRTANSSSYNNLTGMNFSGTGAIDNLSAGYVENAAVQVSVSWTAADTLFNAYSNTEGGDPLSNPYTEGRPGDVIYFMMATQEMAYTYEFTGTGFVIDQGDPSIASYTLTADPSQELNIAVVPKSAPVTPTVIRIAGDKGDIVGNPQNVGDTFSVTPGSGYIAKVFIDGVLAEAVAGLYTAGGTNVIAYVKENAWYLDPFVKNDVNIGYSSSSRTSPAVLNGDDSHLLIANDFNNIYAAYNMVNFYLLGTADFSQLIGGYLGTPVNSVSIKGGEKAQGIVDHQQEGFNGYVECGDFILASSSQGACHGGIPVVMPIAGNWGGYTNGMANIEANPGDRYYPVAFDINNGTMPGAKGANWPNGLQWFARAVASTDKQSIYFSIYARNEITKATVSTNAEGKVSVVKSGIFWRTWNDQAVHASHSAQALALFNDGTKDIVLAALADGRLVKLDEENLSGNTYTNCYSIEKSEPAYVQDHAIVELASSGFACNTMEVTGVADGTPHLVCQFANGNTKVYALNMDGTLVCETPIADIAATAYGAPKCWNTLAAQDNELVAYGAYPAGAGNGDSHLATVTARPANVTVRGTFSTYEAGVDTNITYGAAAEVTYTAPAGCTITAVTVNGVADSNFTAAGYTFSSAALSNNVYIAMTTERIPTVIRISQDGTTTNEYSDLHLALSEAVAGETVKLLADIDLGNAEWAPIMNFPATFDGDGKVISNLKITEATASNVGLFGSVSGNARLSDFIVSNATIQVSVSYVGVVLGCGGGSIENVKVTGTIQVSSSKGGYVAGIVGHGQYSSYKNLEVDGLDKNTSYIQAGSSSVGGIWGMAGEGAGKLENVVVKNITIRGGGNTAAICGRFHYGNRIINGYAENVDVISSSQGTSGELLGDVRTDKGSYSYIFDVTGSNISLAWTNGTAIVDQTFGNVTNGVRNVIIGTDVMGNNVHISASNFGLTNGTFKCYSDASKTALEGQLAAGYALFANGDGAYTIKLAWNVTFMNGDTTVDQQVVADNGFATNVVLAVAGFQGWTNAVSASPINIAEYAITADTTFYAMIQSAPSYPTYLEDADPAMKAKYDTWAQTYGADTGSAYASQFLMNIDPSATATLEIESIEIVDGDAQIVISGGSADLEDINGVLYVRSAATLSGLSSGTVTSTNFSFDKGKATVTLSDVGEFFKAYVDFAVPSAE